MEARLGSQRDDFGLGGVSSPPHGSPEPPLHPPPLALFPASFSCPSFGDAALCQQCRVTT